MLIGTGHLLFADREAGPPTPEMLGKVVTAAIAGVVR
jgi:hypothetical protein